MSVSIRIVGVNIPNKPIFIALTYIYGIGRTRALKICTEAKIVPAKRAAELSEDEVARIRTVIDSNSADYPVEGDLKRIVISNIKNKMDLATYQGLRHRAGLPVRGQRTHTNARTRKGPAKTIAGKKK